jgi:DNA repair protein RadC
MIDSNLKTVRRSTWKRSGKSRGTAEGHIVARYRLRLIKEEQEPVSEPETLIRPPEIAAFLWDRVFEGMDREVMCAVYVDHRRRVIGWTVAYIGCLSRCSVEPRGLVVPGLLVNAMGLAIAHNHPAGSSEPSDEDRLFTRQMQWACEVLHLNLIDSLVVAEGPTGPRWTSILATANS